MDGEKKEPGHQVMGLQQLVFPESPQAEFPFFLVHPETAYLGVVEVRFQNKGEVFAGLSLMACARQ